MLSRPLAYARRALEIALGRILVARPIRRGPKAHVGELLVVSLTSYPARFPTLHLTLRSLLNQSLTPDHLTLWIDRDAIAQLPEAVTKLCSLGLEIWPCDDIGPLTKFLPALENFPSAYIAIADDDIYYRRHWLRDLVKDSSANPDVIIAHNIRLPKWRDGKLAPIAEWDMNYTGRDSLIPSDQFLAVGVAGVLYPPNSLHRDVFDRAAYRKFSRTCDDTWLSWMARRQGTLVRRSDAKIIRRLIGWRGTNAGSLSAQNFARGAAVMQQDILMEQMSAHFGTFDKLC